MQCNTLLCLVSFFMEWTLLWMLLCLNCFELSSLNQLYAKLTVLIQIHTVYYILVDIWGRVTTFKLRFWMTFVGHFRECVKRTSLFYEMHQFFSKSTSRQNNVILFFYCSNLRICFVFCYTICSDFIKLSACKGFATLIDMSYGSVILLFRWLFSA